MTRSNARELAAHLLLEMDYTGASPEECLQTRLDADYYAMLAEENELYAERPNKKQLAYIEQCVKGVAERADELDALISRFSVGWNLHRISRFTKAALRLAIYEILYVEDVPTGAAINECVELTRKYEEAEIVAFANGILGSFARSMNEAEGFEALAEETPMRDEPEASEETAQ